MYRRIAFLLASILAFALVAGVASAVRGTPDTDTDAAVTAVVD
jgi:hypothetical protein